MGDEGGFAPSLPSNRDAIEVVMRAIEAAGYLPGRDVFLTLDVAASELYDRDSGRYLLEREGRTLDAGQLVDLYAEWKQSYPIVSIEDGLDEDDWEGWAELTRRLGATAQLVGDDLFVTNISAFRRGVDEGAGNSVLLKPNQIGTLNRNSSSSANDAGCRLGRGYESSLRRDGRYHYRGYRRGMERRSNQDRRAGKVGTRSQV